jgi:hypothetical protein
MDNQATIIKQAIMARKDRILYVTRTHVWELKREWDCPSMDVEQSFNGEDCLYIRCNKKGEVKWETAPVYKYWELIERNNVKTVSREVATNTGFIYATA